jgi:hypothetical protein
MSDQYQNLRIQFATYENSREGAKSPSGIQQLKTWKQLQPSLEHILDLDKLAVQHFALPVEGQLTFTSIFIQFINQNQISGIVNN